MASVKIKTKTLPVIPRKRYRFLVEWAASNITETFTVQLRWWNSLRTVSTDWTILSTVANVADKWQINTVSVVPPGDARWVQIMVSKANVTVKFGVARVELKEFDQSLAHDARSIRLFDDFIGTAIGAEAWNRTEISGTLSVTKVIPGAGATAQWSETGIARVRTGATNGNGGTIQLGQSLSGPPPVGGEFRCKARVNQTTNFRAWFGLWSNASQSPDEALANTIHGIGFRAQPAGAGENWFGLTRTGITETTVDLSVSANSTWRELGWYKTPTGFQFTVNGYNVGSPITTTIPANGQSLGLMAGLITATGAAAELDLDYIGIQAYSTRIL